MDSNQQLIHWILLLSSENKTRIFEFKLPFQPRQQKPALPHSNVTRLDL